MKAMSFSSLLALMLLSALGANAQELSVETKPAATPSSAVKPDGDSAPEKNTDGEQPGVRRALLLCGLAGDMDHRKQFGETLELLHAGLIKNYGFAAENITVLWGDEAQAKDGPAVASSKVATRESIAEAADTLRAATQPADALWVIVLGHTHYDNKLSWINISGSDLSHVEFGKLFSGIACREQVFFITTPVSGFFARTLAAPGRIVMTATEADQEVNETIFPHKLAKNIAEPPALKDFDVNGDGRATLFDLYLKTVKDTLEDYAANEFLATEHALLEDNGDGRASEVQLDYFSEELGGRRRAGKGVPPRPIGDGEVANRFLVKVPANPSETTAEPESKTADQTKEPDLKEEQ